jgi:hypothetical protein
MWRGVTAPGGQSILLTHQKRPSSAGAEAGAALQSLGKQVWPQSTATGDHRQPIGGGGHADIEQGFEPWNSAIINVSQDHRRRFEPFEE